MTSQSTHPRTLTDDESWDIKRRGRPSPNLLTGLRIYAGVTKNFYSAYQRSAAMKWMGGPAIYASATLQSRAPFIIQQTRTAAACWFGTSTAIDQGELRRR